MDPIDKIYKKHFRSAAGDSGRRLTEEEVRLLVENKLDGERLEDVLKRLSGSPEDQEWVASVRRAMDPASFHADPLPERLSRSVLARPGHERTASKCPHCGGAITPFKRSPRRQKLEIAAWTILSAAAFGLSFVFRHHFMQCLAVSVLCGMKAVLDGRALKTQIYIYRALEGSDDRSARHDLQRDDARL